MRIQSQSLWRKKKKFQQRLCRHFFPCRLKRNRWRYSGGMTLCQCKGCTRHWAFPDPSESGACQREQIHLSLWAVLSFYLSFLGVEEHVYGSENFHSMLNLAFLYIWTILRTWRTFLFLVNQYSVHRHFIKGRTMTRSSPGYVTPKEFPILNIPAGCSHTTGLSGLPSIWLDRVPEGNIQKHKERDASEVDKSQQTRKHRAQMAFPFLAD